MHIVPKSLRVLVLLIVVVVALVGAAWFGVDLFSSVIYPPGEFEITMSNGETLVVYEEVRLFNVRSDHPFEFASEEKPFAAQAIVPEIVLPPGRYYLQVGGGVKAEVVTTGDLEVVVVPETGLRGISYLMILVVLVAVCLWIGDWALFK